MLQISQLLDRFKNLTNTDKVKKQLIIEIIIKHKIPLNISQLSIENNKLFIKTQPIIKTEIILNEKEILSEINSIKGLEHIIKIQ